MREHPPKVITIPAKPDAVNQQVIPRQLRVAAYCRVSTDDEEQLTSYEAQQTYYTDKIMTNRDWTMAGIFADEGITGTSARKRPEFLRMIRQCRQKKIDIILTKSISRFARNTVDCLNYIRVLRELGIAVIFEKENINTLEADSEILITMLGAFAQAESESISANVRWGKRQAMREGKAHIQYNRLYAYEKGEDGNPKIIPEQAEVVQSIYDQYLTGASLRMIKERLESEQIPNGVGNIHWTLSSIRSILTNEKYCGDVLLQKTYVSDCISRKVIRNTGQLPMYLVQNHHEGIVDRKTFDAVQTEMARRNAEKSPSKKNAITGMTSYASKYALSERLVCGECGTLYRRCTWSRQGKKRVVWRCVSRLDYGTKYCHHSPTLDEEPLQQAILAAINSVMSQKTSLIRQITSAIELELAPVPGQSMSLADIEQRLTELSGQTRELVAKAATAQNSAPYTSQLSAIMNEAAALKEKRAYLEKQRQDNAQIVQRIENAAATMEQTSANISEWDEALIRQLVDTVKVQSAEKITVFLRGGVQIEQSMV
ncbi:recombinase family protein [Pseudoflavonifractor capillosus]|uniref:recombinase family protein n=1 Tax=Pseudoflavonifractor capillosus TaxID=106588 RepID=UPI00195A6B8B|nr:recombinase family protein [Pseudoflavonifractor capillosus]MBM6897532.1 recombinase family protein [Pseudoflavonifractor capillosus]